MTNTHKALQPFDAAVLAGGRSSRMGTDKAFLPWQGRRLIDRQVELLRSLGPAQLLVSGRAGVDYGIAGANVVVDTVPDLGPLGGLVALLEASTTPRILVLAVDMPAMTPEFLTRLLQRCTSGTGAVVRTQHGWEPLVAVYPRTLLPVANKRLAIGKLALRGLVEEGVADGMLETLEAGPSEADLFRNLNTPDDLGV